MTCGLCYVFRVVNDRWVVLGGLCYVVHAVKGRWVVLGGSCTCYVVHTRVMCAI